MADKPQDRETWGERIVAQQSTLSMKLQNSFWLANHNDGKHAEIPCQSIRTCSIMLAVLLWQIRVLIGGFFVTLLKIGNLQHTLIYTAANPARIEKLMWEKITVLN
jgi:hypothetical protein